MFLSHKHSLLIIQKLHFEFAKCARREIMWDTFLTHSVQLSDRKAGCFGFLYQPEVVQVPAVLKRHELRFKHGRTSAPDPSRSCLSHEGRTKTLIDTFLRFKAVAEIKTEAELCI